MLSEWFAASLILTCFRQLFPAAGDTRVMPSFRFPGLMVTQDLLASAKATEDDPSNWAGIPYQLLVAQHNQKLGLLFMPYPPCFR